MSDIVKFKFGADASQVNQSLADVRQKMDNLKESVVNGFSAIGLDAVLSLFDKLRGAVGQLGQMFSACTQAVAELEPLGTCARGLHGASGGAG